MLIIKCSASPLHRPRADRAHERHGIHRVHNNSIVRARLHPCVDEPGYTKHSYTKLLTLTLLIVRGIVNQPYRARAKFNT